MPTLAIHSALFPRTSNVRQITDVLFDVCSASKRDLGEVSTDNDGCISDALIFENDVIDFLWFPQALETAMDEEENLTKEIEEEQEQALQSAIKKEEAYLKEIEREEQNEIFVEAIPDIDIEMEQEVRVNVYIDPSMF